jgi:LacI family transcriptional regulator
VRFRQVDVQEKTGNMVTIPWKRFHASHEEVDEMVVVTIRDVAARAGVSVATTSRVLSGHPATSVEARDRVFAAAKNLDFLPNAQARTLRSTRSQSLGLLVPDVRNPFFADLAHAFEQTALASEYVTLLGNANEQQDQQDLYLETLISRQVDGIVLAPLGEGSSSIAQLIKRKIPTVFVDRILEGVAVPSVTTDSDTGIRQAVEHLVAQGHTRIGYISGPQTTSTGRDRHTAFMRAVRENGLNLDPNLIYLGDFQSASGAIGTRELLSQENPPTAILAADNAMAVGAVATLHELNRQIGGDLALIAFDDIEWFSLLNPALSVISHSVADMGRIAAELLVEVIGGGTPESVVLPSELIIRASSSGAHVSPTPNPTPTSRRS